jgi:hypothetical protein
MNHPMYESGYQMAYHLIEMGLSTSFIWMPLVMIGVVISIIKWIHRTGRTGGNADAMYEDYIDFRGDIDRLPGRWERARNRKGWR